MKTSNKILLITFCLILFITSLMIAGMGVFSFYNHPHLIKIISGPAKLVSKEYAIKDFTSLKLEGFWKVKIIRDDSFSISLKAPEEMIKYIKPNVSKKTLTIKQEYFSGIIPSLVEISISMPFLKRIISSGRNHIEFSGFKEDQMVIESKGFNRIKGKNSYIKNLKLSGCSIINYDLGSSTVVNAQLALSGFGTTTLHMAGGKLEGRISGFIRIVYNGSIGLKNIDIFEEAEIIRKTSESNYQRENL